MLNEPIYVSYFTYATKMQLFKKLNPSSRIIQTIQTSKNSNLLKPTFLQSYGLNLWNFNLFLWEDGRYRTKMITVVCHDICVIAMFTEIQTQPASC